MSEVRTQKIRTSLAQQMAQPGGRTLADVERRANERLGRHKAEVMAEIDEAQWCTVAAPQSGRRWAPLMTEHILPALRVLPL